MRDPLERMRRWEDDYRAKGIGLDDDAIRLCDDAAAAANEIKRLRAEVERLRAALGDLLDDAIRLDLTANDRFATYQISNAAIDAARAALSPGTSHEPR